MGEEGGGEKKENRRRVESLGWLTESSIMPKKHRAIAGVGPSSILELKAQLYKSQEELKRSKEQHSTAADNIEYLRAKKKISPHDPLALKNSGVDARALKDKLELKAVNDGTVSYAALERKAELYEKLVKGELSDEEDKYCVDFFSKSLMQDRQQQPHGHNSPDINSLREEDRGDDTLMPHHTKSMGLGRTAATLDRDEHVRLVSEVHEETNKEREKVSELKLRRQEQAAARREKLKQAYLRKQLEKLKAASKTHET